MKYRDVKLDDWIDVSYRGTVAVGKVRRIGSMQANGWAMVTLDVAGEQAFVPLREIEIANPTRHPAR